MEKETLEMRPARIGVEMTDGAIKDFMGQNRRNYLELKGGETTVLIGEPLGDLNVIQCLYKNEDNLVTFKGYGENDRIALAKFAKKFTWMYFGQGVFLDAKFVGDSYNELEIRFYTK